MAGQKASLEASRKKGSGAESRGEGRGADGWRGRGAPPCCALSKSGGHAWIYQVPGKHQRGVITTARGGGIDERGVVARGYGARAMKSGKTVVFCRERALLHAQRWDVTAHCGRLGSGGQRLAACGGMPEKGEDGSFLHVWS